MALGLGQLAGGLLLGGVFGGLLDQNKDQQPTQVASNTPQQGGGGFLGGFSNSMFQGMSPEQVARLGMGFNTMRLDPDPTMASSFQSTIDTSIANAKLAKSKSDTIDWLRGRKSEKFPNGRVDLIDMIDNNIVSPPEAVSMALAVVKPSALEEKFSTYDKLFKQYPDGIPTHMLDMLGINDTMANSIEEFIFYRDEEGGELGYLEFLATKGDRTDIRINSSGKPENYTPFWEALDKAYGPEYLEWTGGMGADTWGNLVKVQEVLDALKSGEQLTGAIIGSMPDFINKFLNPDVTQAREAVESVVQRNLKAILGAQFTEKEGERLISRAYNPKLPPEMNAQRLGILVEQMKQAVKAKNAQAEWVREHGTLMGWTGDLPTWNDFWTASSAHEIGDIVCTNQTGKDKQCFAYQGGDDESKDNWKLVE